MAGSRDYDDIPGTYVFDGRRSQQGYHLNMFCMSLNAEANRERFKADEEAYLDGFDLTPQQRRAVIERDWLGLLRLGGNIYYTFKLAALDGLSMQDIGGAMSGVSGGEFNQMMIDGGRPADGNRRTGEAPAGQSSGTPGAEATDSAGHRS
ncbi:protocatechuate 4,5-dioxygenase subunit alpha [Candidatus Poriferisodalis sp.]|uniref:protocatechuate 4,5-dioxygenase subunit alpha n=1 Tax=Candidatus Poriferisodalis sp. TaxID=3101277 RepID=UPI003B023AD7